MIVSFKVYACGCKINIKIYQVSRELCRNEIYIVPLQSICPGIARVWFCATCMWNRSGSACMDLQVGDTYVPSGSINSDCFHIIGDGKNQPYSVGVCRAHEIRIPYLRWDEFFPNIRSLDCGTYILIYISYPNPLLIDPILFVVCQFVYSSPSLSIRIYIYIYRITCHYISIYSNSIISVFFWFLNPTVLPTHIQVRSSHGTILILWLGWAWVRRGEPAI